MSTLLPKNQIGVMSVEHEGKKPFGMQTYFFEDMVKSVSQLQEDIFFFSPLDWEIEKNQIRGYKYVEDTWVVVQGMIPDIIYDRAFSSDESQKLKIEACRNFLNDSKKKILNPFKLAHLLNDKVGFHAFLLKYDIPTLNTNDIKVLEDESFFKHLNGKKVYIKPTFGSKGQGIFVAEREMSQYKLFDSLGNQKILESHEIFVEELDKLTNGEPYFVQEEAQTVMYNDSPFDVRVLVQNYGDRYEVTGKAVRIGQKSSMTSNLNSGGAALPFEALDEFFRSEYQIDAKALEKEIETLCLLCTRTLKQTFGDFCEIGFDVLVSKDHGPIIIEGNAKPSRWVFVKIADFLESNGKDNTYYLGRRKETVSVPMKYASYLLQKYQ